MAARPALEPMERNVTVAVVVQELVCAVACDQQHVEIAVVVGIEQGSVNGDATPAAGMSGGSDVSPLAPGGLAPQLIDSVAAQVNVGEAVVVVVAPQCGGDVGDRRQWMRRVEHEAGRSAIEQHGVSRRTAIVDCAGDEDIDLTVAIDVRRRDAGGMERVEAMPRDARRAQVRGSRVEDRTGRSRRRLPERLVDGDGFGQRSHPRGT